MKYLSWDIGIKNLSYCLMEDDKKILNWEIINLSENKENVEHKCDGLLKSLKKCDKKALKYDIVSKRFFCTKHSKDHQNLVDLKNIKCCHVLTNGNMCGKRVSFESPLKYQCYCKPHSKNYDGVKEIIKKDSKGTMDDLTLRLIEELDNRKHLLEADVITIENQPAFKNPKMKSIQMIIYTYFNLRGRVDVKKKEEYIDRILFLSASNKLKIKFDGKDEVEKQVVTKDKYKKNKELAKLFCLEFLNDENWKTFFMEHKKRDDLADTFLMNVYQFQIDKK